MKVLIVGGGGREHALAWKVAQSEHVELVFVAPGNAGTAIEPKLENIAISAEDVPAILEFAKTEFIDLTIIGPEAPLVAGIVDEFTVAGLACFGPTKAAAILEGSKTFSKDFLKRHHIPTANYESFTEIKSAKNYIEEQNLPIVIKADGLAAGKGVVIAETREQAFVAVDDMLADNKFGEAGHRVVVEEFLIGEEASFIVMSDGKHILPLASSQDHKARDEGDKGPNTGGMGAYSPALVVTAEIHQCIMDDIIEPTIRAMAEEGRTYTGFLYAGLMIAEDGSVKVLEFNCRFGDPETQPIMMRLKSDLYELCLAATQGTLDNIQVTWDQRAALGVVLAAAGYPGSVKKDDDITGLEDVSNGAVKVFHAGTQSSSKNDPENIVTAGGRVLCVTALGENISAAQSQVYEAIKQIHWNGMFYRNDIGHRAISRER